MPPALTIDPGHLNFAMLRQAFRGPVTASIAEGAFADIDRSHAAIDEILTSGRTVYGVNTGFGLLANKSIGTDQLETLQRNLVLSHAAGTGEQLDDATVRLTIMLKVNSLSRGFPAYAAR